VGNVKEDVGEQTAKVPVLYRQASSAILVTQVRKGGVFDHESGGAAEDLLPGEMADGE
jgi:hypothetical protein